MELIEEDILGDGSHTVLIPIQKLQLVLSLCSTDGVLSHEWIRNVSGEGHLNGKNPPPKEASTSVRASILLVFQ